MRKFLTRALGIAAVAVGFAFAGAGMASADTAYDPANLPTTFEEQQAIWIAGGENVGKGAAQLSSAAFAGVPIGAMEYVMAGGDYMASYFPGIG